MRKKVATQLNAIYIFIVIIISPLIELEPPFIAENIVHYLIDILSDPANSWDAVEQLNVVNREANTTKACLITGYGAIGRAVAYAGSFTCFPKIRVSLKLCYPYFFLLLPFLVSQGLGYNVYVFDTDEKRIRNAKEDGFGVWRKGDKGQENLFDVVVGCSGVTSFGKSADDLRHLADRSILVSASSGNHELSFDRFLHRALAHHSLADGVALNPIEEEEKEKHEDEGDDVTVNLMDPSVVFRPELIHANVDFIVACDNRGSSKGFGRKWLRYLNGGFPLTFRGKINAVETFKVCKISFLARCT